MPLRCNIEIVALRNIELSMSLSGLTQNVFYFKPLDITTERTLSLPGKPYPHCLQCH